MNWKAFEHGWFPVSSLSLYPGISPEPSSKKRFLHESFTLSNSAADTISARHPLVLCSSTVLHHSCPQNLFYPDWDTAHHDWNSLIPERAKWELNGKQLQQKELHLRNRVRLCWSQSHQNWIFPGASWLFFLPAGERKALCDAENSLSRCPMVGQVIWRIMAR